MSDPFRDLGAMLTGTEAKQLADRLAVGDTMTRALSVVAHTRRTGVRDHLDRAGIGAANRTMAVRVLRSIEGAHSHPMTITPVWSAPDNRVQSGHLTATLEHFVRAARESVVCSTFNFQRSSAQWTVLREVAARTGVDVRVYVDAAACKGSQTPSSMEIATALAGAKVYQTKPGTRVRNHAKFIAVDHQYLIVTSANFSFSAEQRNVELGLLLENPLLTRSIEQQMAALTDLYERVQPATR